MRSVVPCLLLLPLALLPRTAHADSMDQFSIVGGGLDIEFSLPASTTEPNFGTQYLVSPLTGKVNGIASVIHADFVFPGGCAGCGTIDLQTDGRSLFIGLPPLYELSVQQPYTETLTFVPGSYNTFTQFSFDGPTYTITVTPEATAATPEPSSLCLVGTAALISLGALRRRSIR